jgi:hypothetical protein
MVDENKVENIVEESKTAEAEQKIIPDNKETVAVPEPQIDPAVLDSIRGELDSIKSESKKDKEVINKIKSVFSDNKDNAEFNEAEFVDKLVKNPLKALDEYYEKRRSSDREELEKLKQEFKQTKVVDEDTRQLASIKAKDRDYDIVMANLGRVISQDEFASLHKSLEDNPMRNEIIYNTMKARVMQLEDVRKQTEENAASQAKEQINKTARTLQPTGGSIETKTPFDDRREKISKARDKFDVDSVLDEVFDGDYSELWKRRQNA